MITEFQRKDATLEWLAELHWLPRRRERGIMQHDGPDPPGNERDEVPSHHEHPGKLAEIAASYEAHC